MNNKKFKELFSKKPIIGMIHLAGPNPMGKVKRALEELEVFEKNGLDGAIIENYHGEYEDVINTLKETCLLNLNLVLGINILGNPNLAFKLAIDYGAKFVQFDDFYDLDLMKRNQEIAVFGGVGFKYIKSTGNGLEHDLRVAKSRCEAIVTTGPGTGIETPIEKLKQYKSLLGDFPLIVGAGLNANNAYEQLKVADGAIVGSYLKMNNKTAYPLNFLRVIEIVEIGNRVNED